MNTPWFAFAACLTGALALGACSGSESSSQGDNADISDEADGPEVDDLDTKADGVSKPLGTYKIVGQVQTGQLSMLVVESNNVFIGAEAKKCTSAGSCETRMIRGTYKFTKRTTKRYISTTITSWDPQGGVAPAKNKTYEYKLSNTSLKVRFGSTWVDFALAQDPYCQVVSDCNVQGVDTSYCAGAWNCSASTCNYVCGATPACLFGSTFGELKSSSTVLVTSQNELNAQTPLLPVEEQQIVRAMHASTHTDVTTAAEAFAAADGHVINKLDIYDTQGLRSFTAYEYGAGDNSYGAVFVQHEVNVVAEIHDGDLQGCNVFAETCIVGPTWQDTLTSPNFKVLSKKVLTASSALDPAATSQVIRGVQESYSDVQTLSEAFASVDQGMINFVSLQHIPTGQSYTAVEYGAGDNSYGDIFVGATTNVAGAINDGDIYRCTVFAK